MGCHNRQAKAGRQLHRRADVAFVIGALGALQLNVKTMRKHSRQMQRTFHGPGVVALYQSLSYSTALSTRKRDQTGVQLFQPCQLDDRLVAHQVFCPGTRQQFRQIQVTLVVLHQQQQAGRGCAGFFARHFDPDISPDQRLDAGFSAFLVKLDRAKEIAQIGNGQCSLVVGRCGCDDFIDAVGPVND